MTSNDIAWKIIDYWVTTEYDGNQESLSDEIGNLDNYAYRIAEAIEKKGIDTSDIAQCAMEVELYI